MIFLQNRFEVTRIELLCLRKNVILPFTRDYTSNVGVTTPAQIQYAIGVLKRKTKRTHLLSRQSLLESHSPDPAQLRFASSAPVTGQFPLDNYLLDNYPPLTIPTQGNFSQSNSHLGQLSPGQLPPGQLSPM